MENAALNSIWAELERKDVKLVAVSKTKPIEQIQKIYDQGQRIFGENRAMEMQEKHELLPSDIQWHMIGHLQTKKTKYIAPFVDMIHSVDTLKLLQEIEKQAEKNDRMIRVLIQVKIAQEASKYGVAPEELDQFMTEVLELQLDHVRICGLMGMASFVDDEQQIASEFSLLAKTFKHIKKQYFADLGDFRELSMGMSGDYKIAIEHGSTMVRIGSLIFGERDYT